MISFVLDEEQEEMARSFVSLHRESCASARPLTLGEHFTYTFTPTGLGVIATVRCTLCGEELDLTDYDSC